jgi:hypothetical protein
MSNEFAIAAVTIALSNLLEGIRKLKDDPDLLKKIPEGLKPTSNIEIITLPLDAAYVPKNKGKNYVNLFLYNVEHSAAWRNMDIPGQVKQGETGHSPLALNLYYIITGHGQDDNELIGHLLLGKAMSILHDHSLLGRDELKTAFEASGLQSQVERLRISPQPISLDEISKLWTGFQTQYRLSAAYEVSVVLIESKQPTRTPLPVLTRGDIHDKGVSVQPHLIPPFPTLESVTLPDNQTGALLEDPLTFTGHHLAGDTVTMSFSHPLLTTEHKISVTPGFRSDTQITITLPNEPANWPAGFYKIAAHITKTGEQDRTTNEIPLMLMPKINLPIQTPVSSVVDGEYKVTITITCSPRVWVKQKVSLLFGDREFPPQPPPDPEQEQYDDLIFLMLDVLKGKYFVRLRVDGVDSPLIDNSDKVPVFDKDYEVTIP